MSAKSDISDEDFVRLFESLGPTQLSRQHDVQIRSVYERRARLEGKLRRRIIAPVQMRVQRPTEDHPERIGLTVENGTILVGSDSHYFPGIITPAHRAFVLFCEKLKPVAVIKNGDELDGASISRHPPIGWTHQPTVKEEIEAVKDRLGEITTASGRAERIWPLGNHDARFETRLAMVAPEFAKVHGTSLHDHFPDWRPCWSVYVNDDLVIKHRARSGIHAPHNNTLWGGRTIVTGHLHSLKVMPISDYNGTRWGVDCGTLADPYGPQFVGYMEDSARNWRSGFVVLTYKNGILLWPEIVHVIDDNHVDFRGTLIEV